MFEFCIAVVSFPQWIFGSFTFERNFCLHIDMALKTFTYPLKLSFQFIVSLYSDFSFQICMQSKHDPQIFCKKNKLQYYPKLILSHLLQPISLIESSQVVDISQNLLI